MRSAVALGPAEPAVPGWDAGSGHAGSLRLEPGRSGITKAPSNERVWQVGHRGSSLLPGRWYLAGVTSRGI